MVRRLCILSLLAVLWPGLALAQSAALMDAYNQFEALYEQGRYAEAAPLSRSIASCRTTCTWSPCWEAERRRFGALR